MLDGIEQPGDRRLLADIAGTPQTNADLWRDGYDTGRGHGKSCGKVDGFMVAARRLIEVAGNNADADTRDLLAGLAQEFIDAAKHEIGVMEGDK